ncbi:GntR family transcriptional regulator [Bosea sp. NPDC003192]|uniref:GntR family transcriptional regulator n=1 Tax=Bosea sp. NPDC003192 TaxID=3390551 RepID=UPI003CFF7108
MGENADFLTITRPPVALRELAAQTLREAIITGALVPGERLVEASLAKRMGVSRPSIREALSQLAAEKLVTITPNKGPSVAAISWDEAQEIYHVRSLLEGEAAFLFATRAERDDLARMRKALREFERAIAKSETTILVRSTGDFYAVMLSGCGNRIITEVLYGLNARVGVLRARSMSRPGRATHSLQEMGVILKAIENRDPEGARAAAHTHVRGAAAAARESFDRMNAERAAG